MAKPIQLGSSTAAGKCPICRKPVEHAHRPFCSKRCADVDLARWLGNGYAIAGAHSDLSDDSADSQTADGGQGARAGLHDDED
jgi:uncharacterized protein